MRMSAKDADKILLEHASTKIQFSRLVSSVAKMAEAYAALETRVAQLEKSIAKSCYTDEDI